MRLLTEKNIEDIALGAAVLGTGGGGDPYIGIPCSHHWRTPEGLALVGPEYFRYEAEYVPVEERYG